MKRKTFNFIFYFIFSLFFSYEKGSLSATKDEEDIMICFDIAKEPTNAKAGASIDEIRADVALRIEREISKVAAQSWRK